MTACLVRIQAWVSLSTALAKPGCRSADTSTLSGQLDNMWTTMLGFRAVV